ncbi:MAG: hypothetical protein AMJ37_01320 [Dehalococcoidia bacterium DG_18]|nr:MAG: hypothetical protein AMJ37_01320 [Dehalococcoidia bacterium DG_18]
MERHELSPHDETILFRLVEIERSLPSEEQSRRFKVEVVSSPGEAPLAVIQPATTSKAFKLKTDVGCFQELRAAGYIVGGRGISSRLEGNVTARSLDIVQLLESAFDYYDEKHDFPTTLADERREFVDSRISTAYPEVVAYMKKAYDAIWVDQPEGNWSSVAHDCQDALKTFANNLYKSEYASTLKKEEPSYADFEEKLDIIISANASGSRHEELRKLLVRLNKYTNARRHDMGTTREEAKRCVLYTYLLMSEICELIQGKE